MFKFRDTCITEVAIIGILEKVIPNNMTIVSYRFYNIMSCTNLWYKT